MGSAAHFGEIMSCCDCGAEKEVELPGCCSECFELRKLILKSGLCADEFQQVQRVIRRRDGTARAVMLRILDGDFGI